MTASEALRNLGRRAEARDGCEKGIALLEALVKEVPDVPSYRSQLAIGLLARGLARRALGDPAGAAADARRALAVWDGLSSRTGDEWYLTACARAALAGLAGKDGSGVSAAEGVSQADAAVAQLRQAIAMGFRDTDTYRNDDTLAPLRGREDFRLLMMDLAMPADPFAAGR